jgi:hypothetical protein
MMLVKVANRIVNLDLLIEATSTHTESSMARDGTMTPSIPALLMRFAGPQPASVGATDWTVESYEIALFGPIAVAMGRYLESLAVSEIAS